MLTSVLSGLPPEPLSTSSGLTPAATTSLTTSSATSAVEIVLSESKRDVWLTCKSSKITFVIKINNRKHSSVLYLCNPNLLWWPKLHLFTQHYRLSEDIPLPGAVMTDVEIVDSTPSPDTKTSFGNDMYETSDISGSETPSYTGTLTLETNPCYTESRTSLLLLFYFSFTSLLLLFYFSFTSLLLLFYFSFTSLLFIFYFFFTSLFGL